MTKINIRHESNRLFFPGQCDPGYVKFGDLCYKLTYVKSPIDFNEAISGCRRVSTT